jgi:hypothetical protein
MLQQLNNKCRNLECIGGGPLLDIAKFAIDLEKNV